MAPGRSVPVIRTTEDGITLDPRPFNDLLDKVGPRPFVSISINGKFRKGKSLTLNFFLQYLEAISRTIGSNAAGCFCGTFVVPAGEGGERVQLVWRRGCGHERDERLVVGAVCGEIVRRKGSLHCPGWTRKGASTTSRLSSKTPSSSR
jgi:hypothetical protein